MTPADLLVARQALETTRRQDPFSRYKAHTGKGRGVKRSFAKTGYSGCKDRPHEPVKFYGGSHVTAKTRRTLTCAATAGAVRALPNAVARLQMLDDRRG